MEGSINALQQRLPLFLAQDEALRKVFFHGQDVALHMAACLLFSRTDKTDLPLEEAADRIRRTPLCFDEAAAELLPLLTVTLATAQDWDRMLYRMQTAFRALGDVFIPSARLVLPAAALAESSVPAEEFDDYAKRIFTIFEEVHQAHPILTGYEDLGVFTLYALYETDDMDVIAHAEAYAERLDDDYFFRNSVQALGHALAFHGNVEEACTRTKQLDEAAKSVKINLRKGSLPTVLAPFVLLDIPPSTFIKRFIETDAYLSKTDAFSSLILSAKERQLFTAMAIAADALHAITPETEQQYAFLAAMYSVTGFHAADSTGHVPV